MPRLPPQPALEWTSQGAPRSTAFDDIYFSHAGGLAESEAVFLAGCGLPERWQGRDRFAICELGFGAGVSVLAAWKAWKATRKPHALLHISTIEAFPLARSDAQRALGEFPEVEREAALLLQHWPVRAYAPQRLWFAKDGLALTVFIGDAETILAGMSGTFDAWFLDGFAPARNPAMWRPELFHHMARLSAPGARAATFTVAGNVRRGLEAAGFAIEKKPGHGAKRERLEATWRRTVRTSQQEESGPEASCPSIYPYAAVHPKRVAIIGAGIAGAACAQSLTRRGIEAVVLEEGRALGAGASGNPAGLVMPRLDRGGGALGEVFLAAYLAAIAAYEEMGALEPCGVLQFPREAGARALGDLLDDPPLPADWLARTGDGAALHPRSGLVRPRHAIERMLEDATLLLEASVQRLEQSDKGWILRAPDGRAIVQADAVVLACGAALSAFEPASFLPITLSLGQIEWGEGRAPAHALTRGNYVAPFDGGVLFGATFDRAEGLGVADEGHGARARNLAALAELAPEISAGVDAARLNSRASFRATTPDRAPIAGLLPDAERWRVQYAALAHGARVDTERAPPAHQGVYVVGGLGARGLTLAPLLGERIASEISGEPMPLSQSALDAVHPARFLHRALKRR